MAAIATELSLSISVKEAVAALLEIQAIAAIEFDREEDASVRLKRVFELASAALREAQFAPQTATLEAMVEKYEIRPDASESKLEPVTLDAQKLPAPWAAPLVQMPGADDLPKPSGNPFAESFEAKYGPK